MQPKTCMKFVVIGVFLVALIAAFPMSLAYASSLTLVSGPSPYAACTIGGPGTSYVNAEVEPWIAVNPTKTQNLIGAWQQDRWDNGGAHGLVAGYSSNGGKSWKETTLPFSACATGGLPYERASDPWVSFGPDGTAYTVSISFNQSNNNNAVAAATSSDGGQTWGNVRILKADTGTTQFFNDKESVTADPTKAGVAYAVWDRLQSPNANPYADAHAFAYTGPTFSAKTTDGERPGVRQRWCLPLRRTTRPSPTKSSLIPRPIPSTISSTGLLVQAPTPMATMSLFNPQRMAG